MLKRNILLCIIVLCYAAHLYGRQDTILLRIDQEEISRSEFESAYKKRVLSKPDNKEKINDFLTRFINDKLKIAEAKTLGLDITAEFRMKIQQYDEALQMNHPAESVLYDILSFSETLAPHFAERFLVMQIHKYVPQNCSAVELEASKQFMDKLYLELRHNPGAEFKTYVEEYSDDKRCFEFTRMEMNPEFEQVVFAMQKGETSKPFFTPQGIHIVRVLDIRSGMTDSEQKKIAWTRIKRRYSNGADSAFLQQLKDANNYTPNLNNINELLTSGDTEKVLFTLKGRMYTGKDFRRFAETSPKGIKRQLDDFITKSLMDYEYKDLAAMRPEVYLSVKEYEDELLLSEINRREISDKARMDQAGLAAYFSVHKKDYRWPSPRFKGVVLHTRDKAIIPEAKKLVKKKPVDQWGKLIEEYFNFGVVQHVEVNQGIFKVGDNAHVDELVFKKERAIPLSSYPFTAVIGKKIKGPENYKEIVTRLIPDYEKFLETQWLKRLRKAYSVEINEEVLKTVNNN